MPVAPATPPHPATTAELIGSRDACRILDVNNSTLTRWVKSGRVKPAGRLGSSRNNAFVYWRRDIEKIAGELAAQ